MRRTMLTCVIAAAALALSSSAPARAETLKGFGKNAVKEYKRAVGVTERALERNSDRTVAAAEHATRHRDKK